MTDAAVPERRVAIIGGGITGLSAAHRLITLDPNVRVTILEATDRLGGIIHTEAADGFLIEHGPDSFITNKPGGVQLCDEIGFSDRLIPTDDEFRRSLVLRKGRPLPVPDGFMLMAPAKPLAIMATPVLSLRGKLRLLWEAFAPAREVEDESLASFVRRRFGNETLERLVQPLVGGIYTSDPEKLSLRATLPRFLDMEREHGSVIRATLAAQKRAADTEAASGSGARYGLFATAADGLSSLIQAVTQVLQSSGRVDIRTSAAVGSVAMQDPESDNHTNAWQVVMADGTTEPFHAVIVTLPTHAAAALLPSEACRSLAAALRQIPYASSAIVVSGHRLADFSHPLNAFGLVIPHIEGRRILAVSFTSRKFPGRAPEGHVLLRTFVGGAMQPELLEQTDTQISAIVNHELRQILGMSAEPQFCRVVRWERAMPQYHVGHLKLIAEIERQARALPGLEVAGSAYHGVGIPDSIASGRTAAENILHPSAETET